MISRKTYFIFFFSLLLTLLIALLLFNYDNKKKNYQFQLTSEINNFNLITHNGKKFDQSFLSKTPSIFFFFFFNCPDICPATLMKISTIIKELKEDATKFSFYFVTVDPERDTQKHIKEYLINFNNNIIGVTGAVKEVNRFLKYMYVYNEKVILSENYYTYDHSSQMFLFNKKGIFFGTISAGESIEVAVKKISMLN